MPDKCQPIRDEIEGIEKSIELAQEELKTASGAVKAYLILLIKQIQAQLAQKNEDLKDCETSPEPPLKDPRVFGSEITQGLPEYELIAGKDTLARVFVGVPEQVVLSVSAPSTQVAQTKAMHFDLPPFGQSKLDFAILHVIGPRGIDFEVPGQMSTGVFTNLSQSFSEEDNVNFYIDGFQLPHVGTYQFSARFYRGGKLVGTLRLGQRMFHATKDLRILIVVDGGPPGTWVMPTAAWNTLFGALTYVNRNFPVRTGVGPLDGDQTLGLRYAIDPTPFDPDFPGWGPVRQRLNEFNDQQAADGKPDRAEHILTVRTQQPFEGPLGGTGDPGPGGSVAGVTLNVNPPADDVFATLISQEIGHNFLGSQHTPDPDIDAPTAFNLLNRRAITAPRSIMFSFYTGNTNAQSLFLSKDWSNIRQGLLTKDSTGPV